MLRHAHRSLRSRGAVAILAVAALAAFPASATARTTVDPSTLTPAPNPAANPTCGWSGSKVICRSEFYSTVTDAETGIFCDGGQLLESSDRHTLTQRFYNSDLLLTKRQYQEWIDGILYVAETGKLVRWTGTDLTIQTLRVPGDPDSAIAVNSGAGIHLYPAGGGSVTIAGRSIEDFETGDFSAVGSHPDGVDFCALLS